MSAPELLTERERELLKAVREVFDLPRAAPAHYFSRMDAVMERVPRLLGATDDIDDLTTITSIMRALQRIAARPLGYEPEQPVQPVVS